jgi:hypothetical protein
MFTHANRVIAILLHDGLKRLAISANKKTSHSNKTQDLPEDINDVDVLHLLLQQKSDEERRSSARS